MTDMNSDTLAQSWYKDGEYYFLDDNTELRTLRPWKYPESWSGKPWCGWFVGLGRNRDSGVLSESNFAVFLKALKELPEVLVDDVCNGGDGWDEIESVYVVCEGHWACGWIEWIAIHPSNTAAMKLADEMLCALEGYPVLNEEDYYQLKYDEAHSWWLRMGTRERIERCYEDGDSIFAARHDYPPCYVLDSLIEQLN